MEGFNEISTLPEAGRLCVVTDGNGYAVGRAELSIDTVYFRLEDTLIVDENKQTPRLFILGKITHWKYI